MVLADWITTYSFGLSPAPEWSPLTFPHIFTLITLVWACSCLTGLFLCGVERKSSFLKESAHEEQDFTFLEVTKGHTWLCCRHSHRALGTVTLSALSIAECYSCVRGQLSYPSRLSHFSSSPSLLTLPLTRCCQNSWTLFLPHHLNSRYIWYCWYSLAYENHSCFVVFLWPFSPQIPLWAFFFLLFLKC